MTSTPPPDRYGIKTTARSDRPWIRWVLTGLVILVGIGVAYLGYTKFSVKDIDGNQLGFEVVDDRTVNIRFTVTREDPSKPGVCIVRGMSAGKEETGRREVYLEPSTSKTVEITAVVHTTKPPSTGDIYGCSMDVPDYLRAP